QDRVLLLHPATACGRRVPPHAGALLRRPAPAGGDRGAHLVVHFLRERDRHARPRRCRAGHPVGRLTHVSIRHAGTAVMAQTQGAYYVPHGSYWPIIGSFGLLGTVGGAGMWLNEVATGKPIMF